MPEISVILPTYNAVPYIGSAVESILSQTYSDFELLIVDDGSNDGTIEVIEGFDDDRVKLIQRETSGITSALNRGLTEAEGDYIARQDGDDRSMPTRFERQVSLLKKDLEVALVGTAAEIVDESGRITDRRQVLESPSVDDLLARNHFIHGSVMMRSEAVRAVGGYDETFGYTEDYDLWLRLADEYRVRNVNEFLYQFRLVPDSIYGSRLFEVKLWEYFARKRFEGTLDPTVRRRIEKERTVQPLYENLSTTERATLHRETGRELLRYHEFDAAREHLTSALAINADITSICLLALTYLPPRVENTVETMYRVLQNRRYSRRNNEEKTRTDGWSLTR